MYVVDVESPQQNLLEAVQEGAKRGLEAHTNQSSHRTLTFDYQSFPLLAQSYWCLPEAYLNYAGAEPKTTSLIVCRKPKYFVSIISL